MHAAVRIAQAEGAACARLNLDFETAEVLPGEGRVGQRLPYLLRRRRDVDHVDGVRFEFAGVDHALVSLAASYAWTQRAAACAHDLLGFRPRLATIYMSSGQRRVASSGAPVSRRLFRLARICGQPVDTAAMNFESGAPISCTTVSLTVSPCGSSR